MACGALMEFAARKCSRRSQASSWCLLFLLGLTCLQIVNADRRADSSDHRFGASGLLENADGPGVHDKIKLTPWVAIAVVLACICALLANAAGIGGGPIYLPLLMVVIGFDLTPATALSHTIVATSAIASSIYGLIATSPNDPSRSLIDWDLTIFIPALLVGVSVGVLFNVLFPRWLQTIFLTVLLLAVIHKTLHKAMQMWRSEKKNVHLVDRLKREEHIAHEHTDSEDEGILHEEAYHLKPHRVTRSQSLSLQRDRAALQESGEADDSQRPLLGSSQEPPPAATGNAKQAVRGCLGRQPVAKIAAIIILWAVFLLFQQLKTRYNRCSLEYLLLFAAELVLLLIATSLGIWLLARQSKQHPDDVDPELRQVLFQSEEEGAGSGAVWKLSRVAVVMAFAGLLAGLLGIGGALIFNPFLLALGVHPQVTASTSVLMILFTSSAIAISLGFQGYLNFSFAAVFAPLAFFSSILGVLVVGRLIKRTGHTSIIVFILTFLIVVGTILTAVFGGIRSYQEWREGVPMGLKPFCGQ